MWGEYFFIGSLVLAAVAIPLMERSRKPLTFDQLYAKYAPASSFSGDFEGREESPSNPNE